MLASAELCLKLVTEEATQLRTFWGLCRRTMYPALVAEMPSSLSHVNTVLGLFERVKNGNLIIDTRHSWILEFNC